MKFYLKLFLIQFLYIFLKIFYLVPIKKDRILFSANEGNSFNCNPKYIFKYLFKHDRLDYVWCLNHHNNLPEIYRPYVKVVKFLSLKHIYYLLTSKVIISNVGIEPFIPLRKSQIFINTWHGSGAYKKVNLNLGVFTKSQRKYMKQIWKIRSKNTKYFLSGCSEFSIVSSRDFGIDIKRFVKTGMPRNDFFFNFTEEERNNLRSDISKKYNLNPNDLLVLYAPTFRGSHYHQQQVDNQIINTQVIEALETRFKKNATILTRTHHSRNGSRISGSSVDVTDYPDMQELLLACDVLITDYSSSIWDYSFLRKPAFLFMPDLDEYQKNIGFYTPIDKWPFPYATTIQDFCNLILNYSDKENEDRIFRHHKLLGSYETGEACEKTTDIIMNSI